MLREHDRPARSPSASCPPKTAMARSASRTLLAPALPLSRLLLTTVAMAGIQVCYAAQINLGTPHLINLGLTKSLVSLAWLAGPLSGLIVQPLVGLASDACTSPFGRRRPFLLVGALLTALALLLFAAAHPLALLFFSPAAANLPALALAVAAFFLLDFSIQAIQAPLRALVTDILPRHQLARGNACVGFFVGVGNLIGGALSSTRLSRFLPFFPTDVFAVFACAAIMLLFAVTVCLVFTPEVPAARDVRVPTLAATFASGTDARLAEARGVEPRTPRRRVRDALRNIPRPFWPVFMVQLCTWCGFFTMFVYVNAWVGTNVFLGNNRGDLRERARFEEGVRFGGKGNAVTALVTIAYAGLLPKLLERFGVVPVYAFSQVVEAACLMSALFIRGTPGQLEPSRLLKAFTLLDIGLFGIVWATTMGVPWTLIGNALESDPRYGQRLGFFTTLFNASQSFPQLIVAIVSWMVLRVVDDSSVVMFLGGICAAVGAVLVVVLRVDVIAPKRSKGDVEAPEVSKGGRIRKAASVGGGGRGTV